MDMEMTGKMIAKARKRSGMTQEQLAEKTGVSVQAVSKWETGKNLPDIENLMRIAEITDTPYSVLLGGQENIPAGSLQFRDRYFNEENMFTRLRAAAQAEGLPETYQALAYMRRQHTGQFRKKGRYTSELVEYINHPLLMACQAHACGIRDDTLLAAILLHDVAEDTDVSAEEMPFSEEVRRLVKLLTFTKKEGEDTASAKEVYFAGIRGDAKASLIKILDRCSNLSTMAGSFTKERMLSYIEETETYILPLCGSLKGEHPEYSDAAFLVKYQMISLIETIKNLIVS